MSFQSFAHFLGFYLNGKMVYTRVHADWASGAEVVLAWRLRGARVDADEAAETVLKRGEDVSRRIEIRRRRSKAAFFSAEATAFSATDRWDRAHLAERGGGRRC